MSDSKNPNIKIDLTPSEANIIIEALGSMAFKDVYKLIEKVHLSANAAANEHKIDKDN
jgi:hypothetical protein